MVWNTDRRARLPVNWDSIRRRVFAVKGDKCVWRIYDGTLCGKPANQVDHIKAGDDHSISNLQPLCQEHHARKSAREGYDAYRKAKAVARWKAERRFGWKEEHPGKNPETPFKHPWQS